MTQLTLIGKEDLREVIVEAMLPYIQQVQQIRLTLADTQQPQSALMSRKEAAAYLKITLVTLNAWTRQGIIECRRINSRVYYLRSELENLTR